MRTEFPIPLQRTLSKFLTLWRTSRLTRVSLSMIDSRRRPRWTNLHEQLVPELQNMFVLKYFSSQRELIPVGWSVVDEDKDFNLLSSRDPKFAEVEPTDESMVEELNRSRSSRSDSITSEEDEDLPIEPSGHAQTRMTDDSSEDELASHNAPVYFQMQYFFYVVDTD